MQFANTVQLYSPVGIECPRGSRNIPSGIQVAEPFSEEAMLFTKELVLQREVRKPCSHRQEWRDSHDIQHDIYCPVLFSVLSSSPNLSVSLYGACHTFHPTSPALQQFANPDTQSARVNLLSPIKVSFRGELDGISSLIVARKILVEGRANNLAT